MPPISDYLKTNIIHMIIQGLTYPRQTILMISLVLDNQNHPLSVFNFELNFSKLSRLLLPIDISGSHPVKEENLPSL